MGQSRGGGGTMHSRGVGRKLDPISQWFTCDAWVGGFMASFRLHDFLRRLEVLGWRREIIGVRV